MINETKANNISNLELCVIEFFNFSFVSVNLVLPFPFELYTQRNGVSVIGRVLTTGDADLKRWIVIFKALLYFNFKVVQNVLTPKCSLCSHLGPFSAFLFPSFLHENSVLNSLIRVLTHYLAPYF